MSSDIIWEKKKLKDLCVKIGSGATPSGGKESYKTSGISLIRSQNIYNHRFSYDGLAYIDKDQAKKLSNVLVQENDVLLNITGDSVCRCCIVPGDVLPARVNQHVAIVRTDTQKLLPFFAKSYLTTESMQTFMFSLAQTGGTRAALTKGMIENFELPVPDLQEQERICKILLPLDDKIELNNAINKNLEEMAQALFRRWFVDFEFPNENGEPYKSSGGEFEESELGLIPTGWKVRSLDDIATYLNGLAMQKFRPEGYTFIPVIKIKELNQGKTSSESDKASPNIDSKYIVNDGDVLFSWSGTLEIKLWCGGIGGLNQHLFKVTSKEYDKWFYYFWTKNYIEKFRRIASDKATTMGHIKRSDLKESKVLVPGQYVYKVATTVIQPIVDKMIQLSIESFELEGIRDYLLPKLMSGEIRVPLGREYPLVQNFDLPMAAESKAQYSTS